MLSITLKQLEIFSAVVETASFSRAGEQLSFAQSTISSNIAILEEAVGAELFDRSNKKNVVLTDAGRSFYTHAKSILSSCYTLQNSTQNKASPNTISIGANYIPARYILPDVMALYHRAHPASHFLLKEGENGEILDLLEQGKIDICFSTEQPIEDSWKCRTLYQDPVVLGLPYTPRYRAMVEENCPIQEILRSEPVVWNQSVAAIIEQYLQNCSIDKEQLKIVAEVSSEQLAKNAVIGGLGVSFLSYISLKCSLKSSEILFQFLDIDGFHRDIYIMNRKQSNLPAIGKDFIRFLTTEEIDFAKCSH